MMMFTRWRHINLQFKLMSVYPERPTEQSFSELAAVVTISPSNNSHSPTSDLLKNMPPPPPKYEDLEQPPKYEEVATSGAPRDTAAGGAAAAPAAAAAATDSLRIENELADLQAILPALEGQEKTDCQERISQLKTKLESH